MHLFLAQSSIQLVPDGTLLVHLLMVVVMVFILDRTLLKPINRILSQREAEIKRGITEAEALNAAREERIQRYHAALREARGEGYRLLEKERAQALSEKEAKVREAKDAISKKVATAVEATRTQKLDASRELESQASDLGVEITSRILRSGRPS